MGNPTIYYKRTLQGFAYYLTCHSDMKLAKQLNEEKDITKLEEYITNKKNNTSTEEFFYNAGIAFMDTMNYVDKNEGCDGLNASISGLNIFEDFIGLRNEEDEY